MSKQAQRLAALTRKETIQLLRDRRTLMLIIAMPLVELLLFAYAVALTVYHLPMVVMDQSGDPRSRDFVEALVNSQYFDETMCVHSQAEVTAAIDRGDAKVGVIIPPDFASHLDKGDADVLILLDGSEGFSVRSGYGAAALVAQEYALKMVTEKVTRMTSGANADALSAPPIVAATRVLYNPDLRDLWFILPGLIGMIMQTVAVGQAAMTLVREREVGTIEQLLITPARSLELILAKMAPLMILCMLVTGVVLAVGVFWFGVPFQGSLLLYFCLQVLFISSSLGLGLMISAISRTQRQAQQLTMMLMLFSSLLTGLIYPRNSMPIVPQVIGDLIPLTYFIRISRGIMTKGAGLSLVWTDVLALVVYGVVISVLAARSFGKRLD